MFRNFSLFFFGFWSLVGLCNNPVFAKDLRSGKVVITEAKVLEVLLKKNYQILMAKKDMALSKVNLEEALQVYDTVLGATLSYAEDSLQRSNPYQSSKTTQLFFPSVTLSQNTSIGSQIQLGYQNQKVESIYTGGLGPEIPDIKLYEFQLSLSYRQSLAKNLWGKITRGELDVIREKIKAFDLATKAQINGIMFRGLSDYWLYRAAYNQVNYDQIALNKAAKLLKTNREKLKLGLIEDADIHAFEANYYTVKNQLLASQIQLKGLEENLKEMLVISPLYKLVPGKERTWRQYEKEPQIHLQKALRARADYLALKSELKALNIDLKIKRNNRLPTIDFVGSLMLNGIDPKFGGALENTSDFNEAFSVGLELNFPLQNRSAKAKLKRAQLEKSRKILEIKGRERQIYAQVREQWQKLKLARQQLAVISQVKNKNYLKLKAEEKRFNQGRSDTDILIRYESDYVMSRKLEAIANSQYHQAYWELMYVTGQIR